MFGWSVREFKIILVIIIIAFNTAILVYKRSNK